MKDVGSIVSMDVDVSVAEQTRGLDWVHWLLCSVRQRCDSLVWVQITSRTTAQVQWRHFVRERFLPCIGPAIIRSWEIAATRDAAALMAMESMWSALLTPDEQARSNRAGRLLLQRTQGARYQGTLGHYRIAVEEEEASGHIGIVWPTLAHLFQLTPTAMLAEYLRLEWETATRELPGVAQPIGSCSISRVVSDVLSHKPTEPTLLRRRQDA